MAYEKVEWVSNETPLSAANMNHIENGLDNHDRIAALMKTLLDTCIFTADPTEVVSEIESALNEKITITATEVQNVAESE